MTKKTLNEYLLDELNSKIPNRPKLINTLCDILCVGKEAVYRRMRDEVPFTLEEASIISYHLGLSLDILKEVSTLKRPFVFKMANYSNPQKEDLRVISEFIDFLDFIKDSPDTEIGVATKLIPDALHLNYEHITRFYLFKWMYQYDNLNMVKKYEEVKGQDALLELLDNLMNLMQRIKSTYYIFDQRIFENLVDDIKYFSKIGLVNANDIQLLKKDLYSCLENIESIAEKGVNSFGNKTDIYLSNLNFEAGFSYIKSENYKLSLIRAFTMYDISSSDVITYENSLKWMHSLKRASVLISQSGEIQRMDFFNKQREIVNTL